MTGAARIPILAVFTVAGRLPLRSTGPIRGYARFLFSRLRLLCRAMRFTTPLLLPWGPVAYHLGLMRWRTIRNRKERIGIGG